MSHGIKDVYPVFLIFILSSILIFFLRTFITKTALYVDAKMYYAITRSIVKDRDINFDNEFRILSINEKTKNNGLPINIQPPGTSIFWLIPYIQINGLMQILNNVGFGTTSLGYAIPYQIALGIYSIYMGIAGLFFVYLLLRTFFSFEESVVSVSLLFAATNIWFYITLEPLNSHMPSFFLASLFAFILVKMKKLNLSGSFLLGLITGLAALVRTQDIALAFIVIMVFFKSKYRLNFWLIFLTGLALGFLPQVYFWKILFNTFWKSPYFSFGFNFTKPHIFYVLFNLQNGFISATPIMFFAVAGLFLYLKKNRVITKILIVYFVIQLIIVSSYSMYYQTDSYGIRMLITTYPFLSFGLANTIRLITDKIGLLKVIKICMVLIFINTFLAINFIANYR